MLLCALAMVEITPNSLSVEDLMEEESSVMCGCLMCSLGGGGR